MSKRNYTSVAHAVRNILKESEGKTNAELEEMHGFTTINGKIVDPLYPGQKFNTLAEWARFSAEQDQAEDQYDDMFDDEED